MCLYDFLMHPLEKKILKGMRQKLISHARGYVLELGSKTGANFNYYNEKKVEHLVASDLCLDPAITENAPSFASFCECSAHSLPFDDASFDTVVETLVLCTIEDVMTALKEIKRVLRPGGLFLHLDHGLPPSPILATCFRGVNCLWPHFTGGCNLDRKPEHSIRSAGFRYIVQGHDNSRIFRWGVAQKPTTALLQIPGSGKKYIDNSNYYCVH